MLKKIVSLMLVACMVLTVAITASAAGVEPATGDSPITITSAKCVGRTVTVEYTVDASENFDTSKDVTVLFYSPVGPEGEEKYITYNDGTTEKSAIYYADQVDYDNTNKLVFSLPSNLAEGTNYNVLVGGTDVDVPALYKNVEVPAGFMYGDIYENQEINNTDALLIAQYYAGIESALKLIDEEKPYLASAADVYVNGEINNTDALLVAQYYAGIESAMNTIDGLNGK